MKKLILLLVVFSFTSFLFAQDIPTSLGPAPVSSVNTQQEPSPFQIGTRAFTQLSVGGTTFQFGKVFLESCTPTNIGSPFAITFPGGLLYYNGEVYTYNQSSPFQMWKIDTTTGTHTLQFSMTGAPQTNLTGMYWDGTTVYGVSSSLAVSQIFTVNMTTGVCTPIGSASATCAGAIFLTGRLGAQYSAFSVDIVLDNLYKWNKTTGVATLVGPIGGNANYGQDACFDNNDFKLYWMSYTTGPELRTIDTATGTAGAVLCSYTAQATGIVCVPPPQGPPPTPPYYNYMVTGSNNSFPFGITGGKMVQWLIPPATQTGGWNTPSTPLPGGMIDALYIWVGGTYPLGPTTYTNLEILMGQTALTSLTTGQFYSGPMDTVFFRSSIQLQGALNSWVPIALDNPKSFSPDSAIVVQIGQCGASGVTGYPACQTTLSGTHRVWSVGGCPFTPYSGGDGYVIHTGINIFYPTGTGHSNNQVPANYVLEQNYPNPFNPVTNISYAIPKAGNVKLVVYDVVGREVATLVNEVKTPGRYSVSFDASNLASGVYIYKIQAGEFYDVKKMMLVK